MAYVDGKFLQRPERTERIKMLKQKLRAIAELIKSGKASEYHFEMLKRDQAELKKCLLVQRAETDHLFWFYEMFSEAGNPGNPDNLVPSPEVTMETAPEFHARLSQILDNISNVNTTANVAWSASRGHAKSAFLSNSNPVRELCYRKRNLILIVSESQAGSMKFVKWCANQLQFNEKLREHYGPLLHQEVARNIKLSQDQFVTLEGQMLNSGSLGKQIRGIRNGSFRPDMIILDDLESKESNNTHELRVKNLEWFNMEMYPARDITRCATVFMGTIVHPESLLQTILDQRTDFIRKKFPAIIDWPHRMDLWDKFCDIFKNYEPSEEELLNFENASVVSEAPNEKMAMDFYRANKEAMDEGAKVLWEARFPLHKLFMEKVSIGSRAFGTEFQNSALDPESMMFKPDNFLYHTSDMAFPHSEFKISFGIDFAMGKEKGDYSAITVVAQHKRTKVKYVADSYIKRVHPDIFLKDIVDLTRIWQPDVIAAETQFAQEFFVQTLKKQLATIGYPAHSRVKNIQQRSRKELRIESMLPDIEEKNISFNRNHRELITQLERYGIGKSGSNHDDGPDSLEMAISVLKKGAARASIKPQWM